MWVEDSITGEVFPLSTEDANDYNRYWTVKTHYSSIDELFKGFKSGNLVGIGGKHAIGKSALAVNLAFNMAQHGTKVCLFSFEMTSEEVVARLLARMTEIEISELQSQIMKRDQTEAVEDALDLLDTMPLEIHDSPSMTVDAIREVARKSLCGCDEGILIIDCLQLIQPSRDCYESVDERLDSIAVSLKRLAMHLRVPVIVTTQLDQTYSLDDAYPLSHYADIVMFLDYAKSNEGPSGFGLPRDIYIAKFRQGPAGDTLRFAFMPELMLFKRFTHSLPSLPKETVQQMPPPWVRPQDSE